MKPTAPITLSVTFDSATRRKSKEVVLRFTSNLEISPEDLMEMDKLIQTEGWVLFKPNQITLDDIPKVDAPSDTKSPSQRLKSILYVLYMSKERTEDYDTFYRNQMNFVIEHYKNKLPEVT